MKTRHTLLQTIFITVLAVTAGLAAQDVTRGTVTYQHINRYDFRTIFGIFGDSHADEWVDNLPKTDVSGKLLHFTEGKSLYRQDPAAPEISSKLLQEALQKASYFQPPRTMLRQVFTNFAEGKETRQIEFMTRYFLISQDIEKKPWKLTQKMIKVQGYTCMGAELKEGEDIITAYFTSEIPVPAGPAEYSGLPGLILVLEKNGETVFAATAVTLSEPESAVLTEPWQGKAVSQVELDRIKQEKTKEWEETSIMGKYTENEKVKAIHK